MAYTVTDVNGHPSHSNKKSFICQTASDVYNLPTSKTPGKLESLPESDKEPCAIGSDALIIATGDVYVLSPADTWTMLP